MKRFKRFGVMSVLGLLVVLFGLSMTNLNVHAGEENINVTKRTKTPKKLMGTWQFKHYYSAKELGTKHGSMVTWRVKLTRSGKGSYYKHWSGTKKHPYQHLFDKQNFNKVYHTKYKNQYAFTPSKHYRKNVENGQVGYAQIETMKHHRGQLYISIHMEGLDYKRLK